MSASVISPGQFGGRKTMKKDPLSDTRKPAFGGASGAKTMRVDRGSGLPATQTKHRHRKKNAPRQHRAK